MPRPGQNTAGLYHGSHSSFLVVARPSPIIVPTGMVNFPRLPQREGTRMPGVLDVTGRLRVGLIVIGILLLLYLSLIHI